MKLFIVYFLLTIAFSSHSLNSMEKLNQINNDFNKQQEKNTKEWEEAQRAKTQAFAALLQKLNTKEISAQEFMTQCCLINLNPATPHNQDAFTLNNLETQLTIKSFDELLKSNASSLKN